MSGFQSSITPNQTIDQILGLGNYERKFVIQIANKTNHILSRVGAYNDRDNWPLGDIDRLQTAGYQFGGNGPADGFSFGANYEIVGTGKFVQFAASYPVMGRRKIALGSRNSPGRNPAQAIWDNLSDSDDKATSNSPFNIRATIRLNGGSSLIWFYEVSE